MSTFTLAEGATLGAKMSSDGTVYRPDSHGRIHVDNARHARELRASNAKNEYAMVAEAVLPVGPNLPDNYCDGDHGCMFNNLIYRTSCVRCGMELPKHDTLPTEES
jgi:hypothetical protein